MNANTRSTRAVRKAQSFGVLKNACCKNIVQQVGPLPTSSTQQCRPTAAERKITEGRLSRHLPPASPGAAPQASPGACCRRPRCAAGLVLLKSDKAVGFWHSTDEAGSEGLFRMGHNLVGSLNKKERQQCRCWLLRARGNLRGAVCSSVKFRKAHARQTALPQGESSHWKSC